MPQRVKAIFFDLGETLVTQNIEDNMVTKTALEKINRILPKPAPQALLFKLYQKGYRINDAIRSEYNVEIPIYAWMRQLLKKAVGDDPSDPLLNQCIKIIVKARAANAVAFDDSQKTLRRISKRRVKLGIMSNVSSHDVALGILNRVGLRKYFDIIVTSALIGIRKPDPGIFRYALLQLNISPRQAAIVGDSERHDIQGGYAAGFRTVLVNRRHQIGSSLADFQFKTLSDAVPTLESL